MNICNHHLFGLIVLFAVVVIGIISVIREERNDSEPTTADEYNEEWLKSKGIRGESFQMQRQLLCPPNHHHSDSPHIYWRAIWK